MLADAAVGRLDSLATELEQLIASDHPTDEVVARWRGLRRDADVLREHAAANPEAAERLERAIVVLEEKEQVACPAARQAGAGQPAPPAAAVSAGGGAGGRRPAVAEGRRSRAA